MVQQDTSLHTDTFTWAVLNALAVHLAVLDAHGTIVAVNDAWQRFAEENGGGDGATGVGANYFAVCAGAAGPCSEQAVDVVAGMRAVLVGEAAAFELEYPCHGPEQEHWYVLRAVPLGGPRPGLVVSHTEVTEQRRTAQAAAEADSLRRRVEAMERELGQVARLPRGQPQGTPLRRRDPPAFHEAAATYQQLLAEAAARRGFEPAARLSGLEGLGERLAAAGAAPRDVIELHLAAMQLLGENAPAARQQLHLEEGRLLLLELMGHLASYYRAAALAPR